MHNARQSSPRSTSDSRSSRVAIAAPLEGSITQWVDAKRIFIMLKLEIVSMSITSDQAYFYHIISYYIVRALGLRIWRPRLRAIH